MVLTAEGRIFGWGRGSFGRLGTGLEKDCYSPIEVFLPGVSAHSLAANGSGDAVLLQTLCLCWMIVPVVQHVTAPCGLYWLENSVRSSFQTCYPA